MNAKDLTGWLELVDCTAISNATAVNDQLQLIGSGNADVEALPVLWNNEFTYPIQFAVVWSNISPELSETLLRPLCDELVAGEYLLFEEKTKYGLKSFTLQVLLVCSRGVYIANSALLVCEAKRMAGLGRKRGRR